MSASGENSPTESAQQPDTVPRAACGQCFELVDTGDNFCRCCGEMTEHGAAMVRIGKLPRRRTGLAAVRPLSWLESPLAVLPALFVVLGPFALPMLWRSRRFNRGWKVGLTIAVLLATFLLCWYVADVVKRTLEEYQRMGLM